MTEIIINNCVYKLHPIYDLYAGSKDGNIINITKKIPNIGNKNNRGYLICAVRKYAQPGHKVYLVHRFIWECYNGLIPDEKVIDHINNKKDDNQLSNLQLLTQSENNRKSVKDRDFLYVPLNIKTRKCVKATNKNTNEVTYFNSTYSAQQYLAINHGTIKRVCEGYYGRKSGKSKKDGHSYTFEYIKEEDLPNNHIKSLNIKPRRVSDEDKKKNQIESIKNGNKKSMNAKNVIKRSKMATNMLMQKGVTSS